MHFITHRLDVLAATAIDSSLLWRCYTLVLAAWIDVDGAHRGYIRWYSSK